MKATSGPFIAQTQTTQAQIIDSVMGSGKTSAIIDTINNAKHPIMIIVERQSEVDRLADACPNLVSLSEVSQETGQNRLTALEGQVQQGQSIVSTHQLMKRWSDNFLWWAKQQEYELIIDETLSGVLTPVKVKSADLNQFLTLGHIQRQPNSEFNKVTIGKPLLSKYQPLEDTVNNKDCYLFNMSSDETLDPKHYLIEAPRAEMFTVFKKITVLTYLFEGSLLRNYFDLHEIKYKKLSIVDGGIGNYVNANGSAFRHNITIYNGKHNHFHIKRNSKREGLSSSWSELPANQKATRKAIRNVVNAWKPVGCTPEYFAYTFHKAYQPQVHPPQVGRKQLNEYYSDSHKRLTMTDAEKRLVTTLPQTMRGTNEFSHKRFMMYLPNTFMNPIVQRFLKEHDLEVKEDTYALSQMIQWLWRGCIRNDEPMHVYVPSRRMRHLLMAWLDYQPDEMF
jgi:hypothetical protein